MPKDSLNGKVEMMMRLGHLHSRKIKKIITAILYSFGIIFIGVCTALFGINIYSIFNVEIEYYEGGYYFHIGQPLLNEMSLRVIFVSIIQLVAIIGASYFALRGSTKCAKTIISIMIILISLLILIPNLISMRSRPYCIRLEAISNDIAKKTINYFSKNPGANKIPSVTEVIKKIPPGFSVKMYGDPNASIKIVVEGLKDRCPRFNVVNRTIVVRKN